MAIATRPAPAVDQIRGVQRRTLSVLVVTQMLGGIGVAIGVSFGALLVASMAGTAMSGLGQSAAVVGGAVLAVPITRVMRSRGRRPGLALAYLTGATGAAITVVAAALGSIPALMAGLFLFGGGTTANYQARYAAVDLSEPARRGRQLSIIVWATTVGAVTGPNLAPLADSTMHRYGLARYSGPFVFTTMALVVAAVVIVMLLRPDPLTVAQRLARAERDPSATPAATANAAPAPTGLAAAVREVAGSPAARLGISAIAMGHLVMVGVMAMTPVHIDAAGHPDTPRIVGMVLSLHVAGMYAFSPVTGALTDRWGRRPMILGGIALLLAACAVAGTAGHGTARLAIGLTLLGMGWSGTMVAGSTLLSESVGAANKPSVQGLSDLVMGLAGAAGGAASGLIVAWSSYATLTALAAVATLPLIALALRPAVPVRLEGSVEGS